VGHEASERAFAIEFAREGRLTQVKVMCVGMSTQAGMPESHTFEGGRTGYIVRSGHLFMQLFGSVTILARQSVIEAGAKSRLLYDGLDF